MAYNPDKVRATLKLLVQLLNKYHVEYRLFGSIIPAALQGSLHRQLGDFDLLVDKQKINLLDKEFKKIGYHKKERSFWRFAEQLNLYIYNHPNLLELGFFVVQFNKETAVLKAGKFKVVVKNEAIQPTNYTFQGINFIGIPQNTAYTGALISKWNPKRREEFKIFKHHKIKPRPNNYIDVYLGKTKINWSLCLLNFLLNVLGVIRTKLGLPYDFWR